MDISINVQSEHTHTDIHTYRQNSQQYWYIALKFHPIPEIHSRSYNSAVTKSSTYGR